MKKTKIAVLNLPADDAQPLIEMLTKRWPGQLLIANNTSELRRFLREFVVDIAVVHRAASRNDGVAFWPHLAAEHPALPLVVWGETLQSEFFAGRTAPVLFTDTLYPLEDFVMAESVTVTRGRLTGVSLASIVQMLHTERRTCRIRARCAQLAGELYVRNGVLVHATLKRFEPRFAALEMLSWPESDVVFDRLPNTETTTIVDSLNFLLMESARLLDENTANGERRVVQTLSGAPTSTVNWIVPAVIRGDAEALLNEVFQLPGARAAAIVDHQNRVIVHSRTSDAKLEGGVRDALCQLISSVNELCVALGVTTKIDDVLINHGRGFLLVHLLPAMPSHAMLASFDRESATLGLVRSRFVQLAQGFGVGPAPSNPS